MDCETEGHVNRRLRVRVPTSVSLPVRKPVMARLLIALVICVGVVWWFLSRPGPGGDVVSNRVEPMIKTLRDNGCDKVAKMAAGVSGREAMAALKKGIEGCQARSARRAEDAATAANK